MLRITSSVVKIVKQETNVNHIFLQCLNALAFFVFIELFNSSSSDDFTPFPSSTKSPKTILQSATPLSPQPSNPISNIQVVVFYLRAMALLKHTSKEL
jgi:hypothetical protein